jgi:hypothetical protein
MFKTTKVALLTIAATALVMSATTSKSNAWPHSGPFDNQCRYHSEAYVFSDNPMPWIYLEQRHFHDEFILPSGIDGPSWCRYYAYAHGQATANDLCKTYGG